MTKFAVTVLILGILGGCIGILSGLMLLRRDRRDNPSIAIAPRKQIRRGAYLVLVASLALGLLAAGVGSAIEILVASSLLVVLFEVTNTKAGPNRQH
jgi:hypothetical protein